MAITLYMDHNAPRQITQGLLHVSIGVCIHDLELIARAGVPDDLTDSIQFLPL
jgi:hypothetical protein